jgi:hypothetical protein
MTVVVEDAIFVFRGELVQHAVEDSVVDVVEKG